MLRVSQFLKEVSSPTGDQSRRKPGGNRPGPIVIWNLIRRCNLNCLHCYSISADTNFPGELSTQEIFAVLEDLKAFHVPAIILSGGEPLLRPDIFQVAAQAKALGFYVGLSTNGTLIDDGLADKISEAGFNYVGISLDGIGATHDQFRRSQGAYDASLAGIKRCQARGVKVGLRYTMTENNAQDFPAILKLVEAENIDKFYFSHLNYAGRGNKNRKSDALHLTIRRAMDLLFSTCLENIQKGGTKEFVTGNNDADGVYLLLWVARNFPDKAATVKAMLQRWGGNSSGVNVANIDNLGIVHPDTMWWHYPLGSVRDRPFGQIWNDVSDPLMAGLKQHPRPVTGRCGQCQYLDICNGNTRVRAQQLTGDPWSEDPGCYLEDREIGMSPEASAQALEKTLIPLKVLP
ncbi:heme d1 biosynthesis radical SAM protein NirJ [Azospira inquinata]|uniref:Pre-heme d1 synthase n=1 Tax=Azospira inquinata TaxID=2785627 RepID=A0A975SPA2_9RHOO|nr:heme d1 biosynthesis radical SAM protein NirJ [Azospira inquinata]QWT45229.1 heme d1 biosynthesis radical SAM protein NirJ [Azospira inquinata]QWT49439.1 heme d1 biosynthesis radical SAM protein NirJ [Azospira inquinata]